VTGFFKIDHVEYHLGSTGRTVSVSSSLEEGSLLVVKGPSGAGKTTLLKILARLMKCDRAWSLSWEKIGFPILPAVAQQN
jgi:ABC-type sulfate/molybdate transport systems ATPase subunit